MPVFHLSEIDRVTLINFGGKEQECTAELFRQWLDICPNDRLNEAALTVGALCDAIRQIRNDYHYEFGRAERAVNQCVSLQMRVRAQELEPSPRALASHLADALWIRQAAFRDKALLAATLETALVGSPRTADAVDPHAGDTPV